MEHVKDPEIYNFLNESMRGGITNSGGRKIAFSSEFYKYKGNDVIIISL